MKYEEARVEVLKLSGDAHFHMSETVPDRPLSYCKPSYRISIVITGEGVFAGEGSSWKKAIAELKKKIGKIRPQEMAA